MLTSPVTGQSGALSASPVQLDSTNAANGCQAFTIKAPSTNATSAYIGKSGVSSTTGFLLSPGDEFTVERKVQQGQPSYQSTPSKFYAVGTSPDIVTWIAVS